MKVKKEPKVGFKNLLVTGGCGFIGSNFIRYLIYNKKFSGKIINVDKLTYAGNLENLSDIAVAFPSRYVFQKVDICDAVRLNEVLQNLMSMPFATLLPNPTWIVQ